MGRVLKSALLATGAVLSAAPAFGAVLGVDFNSASSATQSGFGFISQPTSGTTNATISKAFTVSDPTVPSNSVTVAITPSTGANIGSRDRSVSAAPNGGAFTYSDLYRDFVFNNGGTGATSTTDSSAMTITLSGLSAGTSYSITFYSWDPQLTAGNSTVRFTNTTTGTQPSPTTGTITYPSVGTSTQAPPPASNQTYSVTLNGIASGSSSTNGTLSFTEVAVAGGIQTVPVLNGLEIAPEPGSAIALTSFAAVGLLRRRARRTI